MNEESLSNRDPGAPLGKELEIAAVLSAFKRNRVTQCRLADRRRALLRRPPLRPGPGRVHRLRPVLGVRRRTDRAGDLRPQRSSTPRSDPQTVFSKAADYPNQSPRGGNQFFGHVAIATDGAMTVSLRDLHGTTLWDRTLDPQ